MRLSPSSPTSCIDDRHATHRVLPLCFAHRRLGVGRSSGRSWVAAGVVLFIFTFSYGAPLIAPVALKSIAADLSSTRAVPALANALAWLGSGAGALAFGWIAERFGIRRTAVFGSVMIGAGLALASRGGTWELLVGHGVLIGLLGGGAINVPLIIYISRWFDRRRGSAVALISCGQYLAGILWPPLVALGIDHLGWRPTMLVFGVASGICMVLAALLFLRPVPDSVRGHRPTGRPSRARVRDVAQIGLRSALRRRLLLLCADGNAAGPCGRHVQRFRHPPCARRANALGAARQRLCEPTVLGVAV
jgi:MFS family permease